MKRLRIVASRRYGTLSPLRYPGGKASLAGLFADLFADLGTKRIRYVEPYAGGAGAGVALLREGLIDSLVVNDIDPAVHAFWSSAVNDNERFVEQIRRVPLTLDEWRHQREVYKKGDQHDPFALGFAFFFLNRTNRSGVLNAGVIGGQSQTGAYRIDARFNRETLADRVEAIGELADSITVLDLDGRSVIQRYGRDKRTFFYVDPPYVRAGSALYLNAFDGRDHVALAESLQKVSRAQWLLTYDVAPVVQRLYSDLYQCRLAITYSAHSPGRAEELIVAPPVVAESLQRVGRTSAGAASA